LMVKYPHQSQGAVDPAATRSVDIMPTIARVTGSGQDFDFAGSPLDQAPANRAVSIRVANNDGNIVTRPLSFFKEGRLRTLSEQTERFPSASPLSTPNFAHTLAIKHLSSPAGKYRLDNPEYLKNVRPGSGWNPGSFVTGSTNVRGQLMAQINGKAAGLTTPSEGRFAMMVHGLKRGDNRLRLFVRSDSHWLPLSRR